MCRRCLGDALKAFGVRIICTLPWAGRLHVACAWIFLRPLHNVLTPVRPNPRTPQNSHQGILGSLSTLVVCADLRPSKICAGLTSLTWAHGHGKASAGFRNLSGMPGMLYMGFRSGTGCEATMNRFIVHWAWRSGLHRTSPKLSWTKASKIFLAPLIRTPWQGLWQLARRARGCGPRRPQM